MNNVCVIGVGYVGLVTGVCFADLGNHVVALDINEKRIENLKCGVLPIFEPGLKEVVERTLKTGRLAFTTDYTEALKNAEFVFICVGTPEGVDGEADLQYVRMAAEAIAQHMDHPLIIINKSTVPVGTGDWVAGIVREHQPKPIPFSVVSCPEFLREGSAIRDFFNPDRTVLGSTDREACNRVAQLHLPLRAPIVITDLRTAEMIKYASNAFLATRISFINEIANVCEALGADVKEVAQGMGYDKRIGHHFLEPGVGYGGSCFEGGETILVQEDKQVSPQSFEALFNRSGQAFQGDHVEIIIPSNLHVRAFDLDSARATTAVVKALTRRSYSGTMVGITASTGQSFRVTADHPVILAARLGFDIVPAIAVRPGDQLIGLEEWLAVPTVESAIEIASTGQRAAQHGFTRHDGYVTLGVLAVEHEEVQTTVYSLETQTGTVVGASGLIFHNCFPKDVKALAYMAQIHGTTPQLLQAVMDINVTQRRQIVIKLQDSLGDLKGKVIGLLGLAFKENTDDIRVSPALEIAEMLHALGAKVRGYDPVAMENTARALPFIDLAEDPYALAEGCDGLVVATPWNEFKSLDMGRIHAAMRQPILVDGRNLYDAALMRQLGFHYRGVGRGYNGALEVLESGSDEK